ncbi:MAG: DUF58 domain-containing protein [Planctomycetes bacterium]|nr:DUF58 domain-containing protein [Planctomycetota bacterium]
MPAATDYLSPQTLSAVGSLELRARMIVEGLLTGMHRSPYQGISVEFAQHRQYTPGDDTRYLDWKVFGRTDKLYLKQYQKETNLDLVVLVDASGSMAYSSGNADPAAPGSWRKYDHAASIGAAMAYLSLRQQDRVGMTVFSDRLIQVSRMSNAHDHWRSLVDLLTTHDPRTSEQHGAPGGAKPADGFATDFVHVFDQVLAKLSRRSLIVLISDLFDATDALDTAFARVHHRRHDMLVLQTLDPAELDFPFRDPSDFIGLESEGKIGLDPHAIRRAYLDALHAHLARVEEATRRFHFDHMVLNSHESLGVPLSQFLARRSASMSKGA